MKATKFWEAASAALMIVIAALVLAPRAGAATEKVLYSFTGGSDGNQPHQGLIFDQAGNLYGATFSGGVYGYGTVFKLTPNSDGSWAESVLYSFTGGSDGGTPDWGRPAFDTAGNLYDVTAGGGNYGYGVVFELTPNADGSWTESVLHQFTGGGDGATPTTTLIFEPCATARSSSAHPKHSSIRFLFL